MRTRARFDRGVTAALVALAATEQHAHAQSYPGRPIRMLVRLPQPSNAIPNSTNSGG